MLLSQHLDEKHSWIEMRYQAYRGLGWVTPHHPEAKNVVLVMIGDNEFWIGPLARRTPLHRDYLARVIKALDGCNPAVIALDIDLESPTPDGTLRDNTEYTAETQALVTTVLEVSRNRPIILAASIEFKSPREPFFLESSVYGELPFSTGKLQRGYINLPFDVRKIPTPQPVHKGGMLDSFALAIVRAQRGESVPDDMKGGDILPFGTFIEKGFPTLSTSDVLAGHCGRIASKIAIIGSRWHKLSFNEGAVTDIHITPVGPMSGAALHANYAEAVLDSRTYRPLPKGLERGIEFSISALFAILLAVKTHRTYQKLAVVLVCSAALIFLSYIAWQNCGYYFDFFFPVAFLLAHAFGHYFVELWLGAH
jgi:CHASE2 domain-containing sensor protein